MNKEELSHLIEYGHEIEFTWNNKDFSITYSGDETEKNYISFCEFYKETTEVCSVDDLCSVERYGTKVIDMLTSINDKDISIY